MFDHMAVCIRHQPWSNPRVEANNDDDDHDYGRQGTILQQNTNVEDMLSRFLLPSRPQVFDLVVSKGINLFDTADSYGTGRLNGRSEQLLGRFTRWVAGVASMADEGPRCLAGQPHSIMGIVVWSLRSSSSLRLLPLKLLHLLVFLLKIPAQAKILASSLLPPSAPYHPDEPSNPRLPHSPAPAPAPPPHTQEASTLGQTASPKTSTSPPCSATCHPNTARKPPPPHAPPPLRPTHLLPPTPHCLALSSTLPK